MEEDRTLTPLERKLRGLLDRRRTNATLRNLTINNDNIDFSSNDFLSLSTNTDLKEAYLRELGNCNLPIGSGGSRLLDGNSTYAENLEAQIASFHNAPSGLLFNSGFDANAGLFACVPQPGDAIVYDELIHASVHDGMKLSRAAKRLPFRHNCVGHLRSILESLMQDNDLRIKLKGGKNHVFVAVEAIYSMDGDLAPLRSIVETVEDVLPTGVGYVVVDEAHATGVLGSLGRGLVCELGLETRVFARLHTFGKAVACNGAIVLGSPLLRHYLINYARPLIYTTFMSYPALAAIQTSYSFLQYGKTTPLANNLRTLIQVLFNELNSVETLAFKKLLTTPQIPPESPIFSVQLEEPKLLAKYLQDSGMMVRAVVPPTVPDGTSRVRICLHAGNTVQEIQRLVCAMEHWCVERSTQGDVPETTRRQKQESVVLARL